MNEAGITVARIAAHAFRGQGVGFVALEAEGNWEGMDAEFTNVVLDRLHARFVGKGEKWILSGMEWFGGIEGGTEAAWHRGRRAKVAVDVEELFGPAVIRLQIGVRDRPRRRDTALVLDEAEVLSPHAKHGGAVDLGLPSDEVRLLGVKVFTILVLPCFPGVVAVIE